MKNINSQISTPARRIDPTDVSAMEDKHLVVNCRTAEIFACDSIEEAHELSATHDIESHRVDPTAYAHPDPAHSGGQFHEGACA